MKKTFFNLLWAVVLTLCAVPAFAGALTDFAENKIVDAVVRGQTLGAPATWHIGLDTASCTEAGGGTEVAGGSYARVAVSADLASWAGTQAAASTTSSSGTSGTTSNNAAVTFPTPSAGWGTVLSIRWWDASSAGNAWVCVPLTVSKTINNGDAVSFPIGTLTLQVDN